MGSSFYGRYFTADKIYADAKIDIINMQGIVIINIAYLQM